MRDARAVLIRAREPAGLIGGLRVVHAGVGQCADVGEPSRFEVIEIDGSVRSRIHSLRAEADVGQCARVIVNEGEGLLLDIIEPEGQGSAVGEGLIVDFDRAPREDYPLPPLMLEGFSWDVPFLPVYKKC